MDLEEISLLIDITEDSMQQTVSHLQTELAKIRTGKANTDMLSNILVPYYGAPTPLTQVANITAADARTLIIQPWEKKTLGAIEKAIFESGLGITPSNDGSMIRLNIPPLTEERRRDFVKRAKAVGEDSKIGIRTARHKAMDEIKKAIKNGLPEDIGKKSEDSIQQLTNKFVEKTDKIVELKEKDIMTV